MAGPVKKAAAKPPAKVDVDKLKPVCPFTGLPVVIRQVAGGKFMAVGTFWQSRLFDEKQPLLHSLMTRDGKEPAFDKYPERIQVGEPRDPSTDDPDRHVRDLRERDKAIDDAVDNALNQ